MTYPEGSFQYWKLEVLKMGKFEDIIKGKFPSKKVNIHIICDDCYKHFKSI